GVGPGQGTGPRPGPGIAPSASGNPTVPPSGAHPTRSQDARFLLQEFSEIHKILGAAPMTALMHRATSGKPGEKRRRRGTAVSAPAVVAFIDRAIWWIVGAPETMARLRRTYVRDEVGCRNLLDKYPGRTRRGLALRKYLGTVSGRAGRPVQPLTVPDPPPGW